MKGQRAFDFLNCPVLPAKPRKASLLIVSDRAVPLAFQRTYLEDHADIIDKAKWVDHEGLAGRITAEWYRQKLDLYREYDIPVLIGGIGFEIAEVQGKATQFFERAKELGFSGVEISDDVIPPLGERRRRLLIKEVREIGLEPFSEVGRKFPDKPLDINEAINTIKGDLDLGVARVTVEAAETNHMMVNGESDKLRRIVGQVGVDKLIFEAGGHELNVPMLVWLINTVGPDLSLENVPIERCIDVTGMKMGLDRRMEYAFLRSLSGEKLNKH